MAAPSIPFGLQYLTADLNGITTSGAVYNLSAGGTPPKFRAFCADPDGGTPRAFVRFYTSGGRFLFYREMTYQGTFSGVPYFDYQPVYNVAAANEKKYLQFAGPSVGGGSFRIRFNGAETEDIPGSGLTAARIQTALEKHPDIGAGQVTVTSGPESRRFYIEFTGRMAHLKLSPTFAITNNLVGGTTLTIGTAAVGGSDFSDDQEEVWWDVVGYDNSRWSGNTTSYRTALGPTRMQMWVDYPPNLTSISPADGGTAGSPRPTFAWNWQSGTIGGIPIRQITIDLYQVIGGEQQEIPHWSWDVTGNSLNGTTSVAVPSAKALPHDTDWVWTITAVKASGAKDTSTQDFDVSYNRPTGTNRAPEATVYSPPDKQYLRMQWTPTSMADNQFIAYVFKVRPADAAEDGPENVEIWRRTDKSRYYAFLTEIPKNRDVIVSFYIEQYVSGTPILSVAREYAVRQDILSVMLVSSTDFLTDYAAIDYHEGRSISYQQSIQYHQLWTRTAPVAVMGGPKSRTISIDAVLDGTMAEQQEQYRRIEALYRNTRGSTLVYTDTDGEVIYCVMDPPEKEKPGGGWNMRVRVRLTEVDNDRAYF